MTARRLPRLVAIPAVLLVGILLAAVLLEAGIRVLHLDHRFMARALYYQFTEVEVCRHSDDPFLRYELAPGSRFESPAHDHTVNVDPHGARGAGHPEPKEPGTFRIVFLGASTLYGAGTNDDETVAAALERGLNNALAVRRTDADSDADVAPDAEAPSDALPSRFEVWNFGLSAYRMSQMARVGRRALERHDPDLILLMFTNTGRRPVLGGDKQRPTTEIARLLESDPHFLPENFPPYDVEPARHWRLWERWGIYRVARAIHRLGQDGDASQYADDVSRDEAGTLLAEAGAAGVPVRFVEIPLFHGMHDRARFFPDPDPDLFIDLWEPDREEEFYEIHPAESMLAEWADTIAAELMERRLVPLEPTAYTAPTVRCEPGNDGVTVGLRDDLSCSVDDPSLTLGLRSDVQGDLGALDADARGDLRVPFAALDVGLHALTITARDDRGVLGTLTLCVNQTGEDVRLHEDDLAPGETR